MTAIHASRPTRPGARDRTRRYALLAGHAPRLLGTVASFVGLFLVAEVLAPAHWRQSSFVGQLLPRSVSATADAVVLVSGWVLLRLARGLRRARVTEARISIAVCVAVVMADFLRGPRRVGEAVVVSLFLVALVLTRAQFTATADPRGRLLALRTAVRLAAVSCGVGLVLLYLPGHVPGRVSFWSRLGEVLASLVGLGGGVAIRGDGYADMVHATLVVCGVLVLVTTVTLWLRPVQPTAALTPGDEARLTDLLARHGRRDSLGYFALRRDKAVVWSPSGKSAVTYRVVDGVALMSGDPIGDPEAWPAAIEAFRTLTAKYGWTPAVMGCSTLGATVLKREWGLRAIELGDEAVITTADFTLTGRGARGVRQACTRAQRAGHDVQVRRMAELDPVEIAELTAAAATWRTDTVERGFSMALSRLGDHADPDCVVVTARRGGTLTGLLHFVPWGPDGISLDLMRRDRCADNGLNEYMIAQLMSAAAGLGIARVSLNFAVFRDALERGARIGAGPVLRLWRRVLLIASHWYQIDSLYRFNAKFNPTWQPRYLCYPRMRDVPRIAIAALEAEAFLAVPPVLRRLSGDAAGRR
jgi:lysyl-tRNA synthetase, class II